MRLLASALLLFLLLLHLPRSASPGEPRAWPLRNDHAACHFLRRARPLADLLGTRRLALAHSGLAEAYRRLNCPLYTAVYAGPALNGAVLADVPARSSREFSTESDEAEFCLSQLAVQQTGVVPASWRVVPIRQALAFIDSGSEDWEGAACDAFALAGMLGRTEWGRELDDVEEGQKYERSEHAGDSAIIIPALDRPRRLCSWLMKTMSGSDIFDNRVLGFRVYVHADFRASVSSLFGCNFHKAAQRHVAGTEDQCLTAWRSIWKPSPDEDDVEIAEDYPLDDTLFDENFHDIPLEHLTMHASAPLRALTALDPSAFERWNALGCDAYVASALTLAESRQEDEGPCYAGGRVEQRCIDQENWRLTYGLQIVDVCFPCGGESSTPPPLAPAATRPSQRRPRRDAAIQKLCDPYAYRDSTPIFPITASGRKEEFVVKGGFIPGATNIALFFETQLVLAMLTRRVLVLPPRGGLIDHLYASGPVDYLLGRWTRQGISRALARNQQIWSWTKFISFMLRRLRHSAAAASAIQHDAMRWHSSVALPLVPRARTISLLRWSGRQFYRGSDFSKIEDLNTTAWPLDNVEDFKDEILHVVGGGGYWLETIKLSAETQAQVEASLTRFRKPFRVMRGLVDAAVKSITSKASPSKKTADAAPGVEPKFKAVQLRLGDIDSLTRQKLPNTAAVIAELTKFGFTAQDIVYLATDDKPEAPFLDAKLLYSAFPLLVRRKDLDILGQECLGPKAPPLPDNSEQDTTVSPWSQYKNVKLEGPRCAALEQAICARADIWVGTRWTSFGPRIGILRAARGKESLWFTEAIGQDGDGYYATGGSNQERRFLLIRERKKEFTEAKKTNKNANERKETKKSSSSMLRSTVV